MKLSKLALCCGLLLSSPLLCAGDLFGKQDGSVDKWQELKSQRNADFEEFRSNNLNSFNSWRTKNLNEFEAWRTAYLKEFDQFRAEVIAKWGDGEVSTSHKSVDYNEEKDVRTVVDYESNEATVAILVDPTMSAEEAQKQVQKVAEQLLAQADSSLAEALEGEAKLPEGKLVENKVSYSNEKEKQAKALIIKQTQAQLQQIDKESESVVAALTDVNTEQLEQEVAKKKEALLAQKDERLKSLEKTYVDARNKAAELTKKKIVEYKVKLPENGLGKRAAKYVDYAEKESERFDISAALVMAIMHSESSFNPRAKSPIPAYGLMQIVPNTAGHDVNARVRNIDAPMKPDELYLADVNVETGTAYLNILDKSYLKSIKDDTSRLYCTIAAYNTGAGNVAKAFNQDGSRNIRKAAKIINKLSPDEVYNQLIDNLPYDETKSYLKKVSGRIALYKKHIS